MPTHELVVFGPGSRSITEDMTIRVLLVEDHSLVRKAVRSLLTQIGKPRLTVVGEAGTGPEAIKQAARLRPDVVLMDIAIPELGGIPSWTSAAWPR